MFKQSDYPDHPKELVVRKNEFYPKGVKEIDIWNYYNGIKSKLVPELKGYDLFVVIAPKAGKELYVRHPYNKKTKFIRVNNKDEFDTYHSGKTVEYHRTSPATTNEAVFDIDPGPSSTFKDIKDAAEATIKFIKSNSLFKSKTNIRFTGSRGFHITAYLKKKKGIAAIKRETEKLLKEHFEDNENFVVAKPKPPGKKVNIDLSPMKVRGGHIVPYSLRIRTGLVSLPIKDISGFKKTDAKLDKVYKKITGKNFKWNDIKKESGCFKVLELINKFGSV